MLNSQPEAVFFPFRRFDFDSDRNPCCSAGNRAPGTLADAAHKIGRPKTDFEVLEIS